MTRAPIISGSERVVDPSIHPDIRSWCISFAEQMRFCDASTPTNWNRTSVDLRVLRRLWYFTNPSVI